jgi:hypothetical protein
MKNHKAHTDEIFVFQPTVLLFVFAATGEWKINLRPSLGISDNNPHSFAGQGYYWFSSLLVTSNMDREHGHHQDSCQGRAV